MSYADSTSSNSAWVAIIAISDCSTVATRLSASSERRANSAAAAKLATVMSTSAAIPIVHTTQAGTPRLGDS